MVCFHSELKKQIHTKRKCILNTLFYGPAGSGKDTLVRCYLEGLFGKQTWNFYDFKDEVTGAIYKVTPNFILIDGYEWKQHKVNVPRCIENITQTQKVSTQECKIIYIRYVDVLLESHQMLRQLIEDSYNECRFLLTARSLDKVDAAIQSRCVTIRVVAPSVDVLTQWGREEMDIDETIGKQIAIDANQNANIMYHMMCAYAITKKYLNLNKVFAESVVENLKKAKTFLEIHEYAEKIFKCNLYYTPILKEMLSYFPGNYKTEALNYIYVFLSKDMRDLFCILELFIGFKKIFHVLEGDENISV